MTPKLDKPELVTTIRKNETTIEIDLESGLMEYDIKIDYDQDVVLEGNKGTINLAYKKYEKGIVHMKDVVGIWGATTPQYEATEDGTSIVETYNHGIEISTIGNPLYFFVERKELKANYEILKEVFAKYKTKA